MTQCVINQILCRIHYITIHFKNAINKPTLTTEKEFPDFILSLNAQSCYTCMCITHHIMILPVKMLQQWVINRPDFKSDILIQTGLVSRERNTCVLHR